MSYIKKQVPFSYCKNMTSLNVLWASVALWNASNTYILWELLSWVLPLALVFDLLLSRQYRRLLFLIFRLFNIFLRCGVRFLQSYFNIISYFTILLNKLFITLYFDTYVIKEAKYLNYFFGILKTKFNAILIDVLKI